MCQLAAVISLAVLALLNASTAGKVLVVVYVVFAKIALPLETLVIPLIVHELFGSKNYTGNLGVLTAMNYIGFAIGGPIVNLCYDTFNTYTPALWAFVGIMVLCMVLFFAVLKKVPTQKNNTTRA